MKYYLAIDIGASSGRHIIGYKDENSNIKMEEIYRFKNGVVKQNNHLIWDIDYLFKEIKEGIKIAINKYQNIESLSIDTWGVDYVLLQNDKIIYPCYAYRDGRTKSRINEVHNIIPFEKLYELTGSQFQEFNTIYQLYDDKMNHRLDNVTDFLMIPEYFIYRLTGKKVKEYTNASTTGMMDEKNNIYSNEILEKLGFERKLFKELNKPGTIVGDFNNDIQKEVGGNIKVVLCATHDTASAVEGIDMKENSPYISSGTWSLLGLKLKKCITSLEAQKANYSNEYGPNYIRFQKNIMGLWLIQELSKQMNYSFQEMVILARTSEYKNIFDVNDNCFLSSLDMRQEIINWFVERKINPPLEDKDIINSCYRSLADSYRVALEELETITKQTFNYLYIVGGGAKNLYLNELTEEFTKKKVVALPIEATSLGNLKSQMEGNKNEKRS